MASGQTLWDQLLAGTGDAIADIREKLVEEPWFGRPLDVSSGDLTLNVEGVQPSRELRQEPQSPDLTPDIGQDQSIDR